MTRLNGAMIFIVNVSFDGRIFDYKSVRNSSQSLRFIQFIHSFMDSDKNTQTQTQTHTDTHNCPLHHRFPFTVIETTIV